MQRHFVLAMVAIALLTGDAMLAVATASESNQLLMSQGRSSRRITRVNFQPPRRGAPRSTIGLGSRGDCLVNNRLRALTPFPYGTSEEATLELTTAAYPTLFIYVPAFDQAAQGLELTIMRVTPTGEEELYTKSFALPAEAGIVGLTPTQADVPPLRVGERYHWYVSMVCHSLGSVDQSGNAIADGWMERVTVDPTLQSRLDTADPLERADLYAQAGIWQDTLIILAELRRTQPNDEILRVIWQELLQSVGLRSIAEAPVLDCCQPTRDL
ncbi:MAG: DUF928 domain-containing protein [Leptolyngbyaceae cyanobacterium SL_7_1]|nr:DUF928 domain-containing protein [Leptolyngbyaceae cyanobacterium SL_7_1]